MDENGASGDPQGQPPMSLELECGRQSFLSLDDDGLPRRTGTMWTASAHILTAVIGSGVLSLAWAVAQLGWVAGPTVMIMFAFVVYYTSALLADCYRSGDPYTGKRNYTYMEAVQANLGGLKVTLCGCIQYINLFGTAVGYNIAAAMSMTAIQKANCFEKKGEGSRSCDASSNPYMISFGVAQLVFSQIPDMQKLWWLSILASAMSLTYSSIGVGLSIAQVARRGRVAGSLMGVSNVTRAQKGWRSLQAFGDIAFAFAYSQVLIEIQDTIKSPPPTEARVMKRANLLSVTVAASFYTLCGCMGYAAFGDSAPGNLLSGFGFYNPYWLLDIANAAVVVHLAGAYQIYAQPIFAFVERWARKRWAGSCLIAAEIPLPLSGIRLNAFQLAWRTAFVVLTTLLSMLLPFFNDVLGLIGAIGFWPLAVYFPAQIYIVQKSVERWSAEWVCLQLMSLLCFVVSLGAIIGSTASIVDDLKVFKPFKTILILSDNDRNRQKNQKPKQLHRDQKQSQRFRQRN